jgi:hypothetical protein
MIEGLERDTVDPDNQSIWFVSWSDTPIRLGERGVRYTPPTRWQRTKRWLPNKIVNARYDIHERITDWRYALSRWIDPYD